MKINLIFLISHNFDKRNRIRLGYYDLINNNFFNSTYWNIQKCNNKLKNLDKNQYKSEFCINYSKKINLILDILKLKHKNAYYVDHTSNSVFDNFVQLLLSFKGYKRIFIKAGSKPTFESKIGNYNYAILLFKESYFLGIKKIIIYFLRLLLQPKADVLVISNNNDEPKKNNLKKNTNIIYSHNFDYDFFIKTNEQNIILKDKFFTFVDQNLPDHPDMTFYRNKEININRKNYWSEIVELLKYLESTFNLKAKIIPHPTTNESILNEFLSEFEIIKEDKSHFIKNSEFVICHESTIVHLAILWNIPIKPIIPESIKKETFYTDNILYFAEELGLKTDLDFKSDLHKQIYNSINKKKYLEYKDKYIISNKSDPNKLFWDIFLDEICLINKKYSEK